MHHQQHHHNDYKNNIHKKQITTKYIAEVACRTKSNIQYTPTFISHALPEIFASFKCKKQSILITLIKSIMYQKIIYKTKLYKFHCLRTVAEHYCRKIKKKSHNPNHSQIHCRNCSPSKPFTCLTIFINQISILAQKFTFHNFFQCIPIALPQMLNLSLNTNT